MSNLALEKYLKEKNINFIRADVGDRYVKEKMKKYNYNLGGEQSGHIILGNFATTGDGLLVALEILHLMKKGIKASELLNELNLTPQILINVPVKNKNILDSLKCKIAIKKAEKLIRNNGRLLVRKSGTEKKIRVMAESKDKILISKCLEIVKRSLNS